VALHDNFVDLMDRLVEKHGREILIRRQTGSALKIAGRPEAGVQPSYTNTTQKVVFLDHDTRDLLLAIPGTADEQTMITREIDRLVMVPAKRLTFELTDDHKIVDGAKVFEITRVVKLQPGPTLVGYIVRVAI